MANFSYPKKKKNLFIKKNQNITDRTRSPDLHPKGQNLYVIKSLRSGIMDGRWAYLDVKSGYKSILELHPFYKSITKKKFTVKHEIISRFIL